MKIGETYWRITPIGDKGMITINTQEEKEYHEDFAKKDGYTYTLQPLPTGGVCISCEG